MHIPDGLPILSAGNHDSPNHGACFMEYTSLLAGEPFTDQPRCTDHELTLVLQQINDLLDDEHRSKLGALLGRAIGLVSPNRDAVLALRANAAAHLTVRLRQTFGLNMSAFEGVRYIGMFASRYMRIIHERNWQDQLIRLAELLHEAYEQAMTDLGMENTFKPVRTLVEAKELVGTH